MKKIYKIVLAEPRKERADKKGEETAACTMEGEIATG